MSRAVSAREMAQGTFLGYLSTKEHTHARGRGMASAAIFFVATTSPVSPKLWVPSDGNPEGEESSTNSLHPGLLEGLHYLS